MSTTISDAYRIKENDPVKISKLTANIMRLLKKSCIVSANKFIASDLADYYLFKVLEKNDDYWEFFKTKTLMDKRSGEKLKFLLNDVYSRDSFVNNYCYMIETATKFDIQNDFNHSANFFINTVGEYTYVKINSIFSIKNEFRDNYSILGLELYEYWNGTDGPEDISDEDWYSRSDEWDAAFDVEVPEVHKFYCNIKAAEIESNEDVVGYITDDITLLKKYLEETLANDVFMKEIKRQKEDGERESNSKAFRLSNQAVRDVFETEKCVHYLKEMENNGYSREIIIKNILKTTLEFPRLF